VLDIANPDAWQHLLERLDSLVGEYAIDFIKWDHNRDLHTAVRNARVDGTRVPDHPSVHDQTAAFYALLDELRRRHPGLEIESCASGGARVDLGVLERTDRVWASDSNDALERQHIQRWTGLLLPPELVGAHVGPAVAHTTARTVDLSMRCVTALFGHAGLEWDITTCSPHELDVLRAWGALYKELRPLLHSGHVVRADLADPGALLHGVVAADAGAAVFAYVRLQTSPAAHPGAVPLPGLDADRRYRVRVRAEAGDAAAVQSGPPGWWHDASAGGVEVSGAMLGEVGLPMPALGPGQAFVLHLTSSG
jgi:alpha-galactosidase